MNMTNKENRPQMQTFSNDDLDELAKHVNSIVRQLVTELRWWKKEAAQKVRLADRSIRLARALLTVGKERDEARRALERIIDEFGLTPSSENPHS